MSHVVVRTTGMPQAGQRRYQLRVTDQRPSIETAAGPATGVVVATP
jgi:hypothetical protein